MKPALAIVILLLVAFGLSYAYKNTNSVVVSPNSAQNHVTPNPTQLEKRQAFKEKISVLSKDDRKELRQEMKSLSVDERNFLKRKIMLANEDELQEIINNL